MACRGGVVEKMKKSLILWEMTTKSSFFSWEKGVFDQKLRGESEKMVSMLYIEDFGSKLAIFDDYGKCFFFYRNSKIEKFKGVPLSWQCMNENRKVMQDT